MADMDLALRMRAVERLQAAEARYAEVAKRAEEFSSDGGASALEAMRSALATEVENSRRELELAKAAAEDASVDAESRRSAEAALREPAPDVRGDGA